MGQVPPEGVATAGEEMEKDEILAIEQPKHLIFKHTVFRWGWG